MSRLQKIILTVILIVYAGLFATGQVSIVPRLRMPASTVYLDDNTTWDDGSTVTIQGDLAIQGDGTDENLYFGSSGAKVSSDSTGKLNISSPQSVFAQSAVSNINIVAGGTTTFNSDQNLILGSPGGVTVDAGNTFTLSAADVDVEQNLEFGSASHPKTYFQPFYDGLLTSTESQQVKSDYGEFDTFQANFVAPFVVQGSYIWKVQVVLYRADRDDGSFNLKAYRALGTTKTRSLLSSETIDLNHSSYKNHFTIETVLNETLSSQESVYLYMDGNAMTYYPIRLLGVKWYYYTRRQ